MIKLQLTPEEEIVTLCKEFEVLYEKFEEEGLMVHGREARAKLLRIQKLTKVVRKNMAETIEQIRKDNIELGRYGAGQNTKGHRKKV